MRIDHSRLRRWLTALLCLPSVALAADPQVAAFTDSPDPVIAGGLYTYTVRVDNNAVDASTNTRLRVTVPSGAAFVSASPSSQNCVATSATQIDCNLGSVAGNGADARLVTMTWRAVVAGLATINAEAVVTADNDVNGANNTLNNETTVVSGANLALTVTGWPASVAPGGSVTYTLTASNSGPNASGDLRVVNTLPPSSVFVSATGSGWSCSHASGTVTCERAGAHAAGAAIPSIAIVATATAGSGTITNTATVNTGTGGISDPDTSDNTGTVNTTILAGADLQIVSKTVVSATPIVAGSNVTFRLTPRNLGPDTASSVVLTDPLPTGWAFVSAGGTNWACTATGQTVSCTRGTMPVGATDDIDIVATAPAPGIPGGASYTNTASISAATADPASGNNAAAVTVTAFPTGADLSLSKAKTPFAAAVGGTLTSTITVTNTGPLTADGPLRVVEVLSNEAFVGASGTGWSCSATGSTVVCNHPNASSLAVGASLPSLLISTTAMASGNLVNTACTGNSIPSGVTGATASPPLAGDPNPANDCATATSIALVSGGTADLQVVSVSTSTPTGGDKRMSATENSVTFTTLMNNAGPSGATGALVRFFIGNFINGSTAAPSMVFSFPPGSSSTATFTCSNINGAGRCEQTGGIWAVGETPTLTVSVNRPLGSTIGSPATLPVDIGNSVEFDLNSANNTGSDIFEVDPLADVELHGNTVTPTPVLAGENTTYVLSYRNNGPDSSSNVAITSTFTFLAADGVTSNPADPGLQVMSFNLSRLGADCTVNGASLAVGTIIAPGSNVLSCVNGFMADGEAHTITLVMRPASQLSNPTRIIRNSSTIVSSSPGESFTGGDNGNNTRVSNLTVLSNAIDLLVNKTDMVDPVPHVAAGATYLDYAIRITSNGPSFGTNVRTAETMVPPSGKRIRFVCDTSTLGGSCNAASLCSTTNVTSAAGVALPTFTCSVPAGNATTGPAVGELAAGQSKDIFLRFQVLDQPPAAGDVFASTSLALSNENETLQANNSVTETTTTRNLIDMRASKVASSPSVSVRQPFNWIATIENRGPGDSQQTDVTDTLPAGTVVTGAITWTKTLPAATGTCTVTGLSVDCPLGRMNAGSVATITVPVRMDTFPAGGIATNQIAVDVSPAKTGAEDFPGGNNTASATVTLTRGSLSGLVFEDRSRAGADAGTPQAAAAEPRLAGVTVELTGTDAFGNAVNRTATTDADGVYAFADLAPSNGAGYTLTQIQPAAYVNGPADTPSSGAGAPSAGGVYARGGVSGNSSYSGVVLGSAATATSYNFPEVRRVSLAGVVYIDVNTSGVYEVGGDTPVVGATVRLLNAAGLTEVATTTTLANGSYSFTNLDPLVTYVLEEPLPVTGGSLASGPVNPGLVGGVACVGCIAQANTPIAGTDRIAGIDLSAGLDGTVFNFGEIQVTAISGTVYIDRNSNGTLDAQPTDGRIPGVSLNLVAGNSCAGTVLATVVSAADGSYSFPGLTAGQTYTVCQTQPAGYADGGVNTGASASSPGANAITVTALPVSGSGGNQFFERLGSVSGSVYLDANNNAQRDGGEAGIAGVTVRLTGTDATGAAVDRSANSDSTGAFSFGDLLASNGAGYTLTQQLAQPVVSGVTTLNGRNAVGTIGGVATGSTTPPAAGVASAISAIVLPAGATSVNHHFGEILPVSLSGLVFSDANNNGAPDGAADPGLSGNTLQLTGTDDLGAAVSVSTTTLLDGSFSFSGLRPGTYTVTQPTQPAGTTNGITTPGTAGGTATGVGTTPSVIGGIALLVPGTASTTNRFAEIPDSGVVSGRVWFDANNDGVINASESGIVGQTLRLTGTTTLGASIDQTAVTLVDGSFSFSGLAAGTYTLTQPAQPAGTFNGMTIAGSGGGTATPVATTPSAITGITLGTGGSAVSNNFGETPGPTISGRVWLDADNNGAINGSEGGLAGVSITLTGTDDLGAAVNLSATTSADGSFSFPGLRPGTYTLTQPAQPAGTLNGRTVPGAAGGTASAVSASPSRVTGIAVVAGQVAGNYLFGEIPPAQVSGRVWTDANHNGVIEASETGLAGVTLNLTGTDDTGAPVSATLTTAADGSYSFGNLRPGSYTVTEPTQPTGTFNGRTVAGTAGGTASAVTSVPSQISGITLAAGQVATGNHFGEITGASLAGRVWLDVNNNGLIDGTESGIAGVTITLSGTDDLGASVAATATTAADGSYSFNGLRPGTYALLQPTQPSGTTNGQTLAGSAGGAPTAPATTPSAITGIALGAGQVSVNNLFAEVPGSSLAGRVFTDTNDNGAVDGTETGLAGVTVTLTGTDDLGATVNRTVVSGTDGGWRFDGLRAGTYVLTQSGSQPAGTLSGRTVAGTAGGTATTPTTANSRISAITLGSAQQATGYLFAEIPPAQLSGRVWADGNNDGIVGSGENGIGSVTVTLTGTDDLGAAVSLSRTSAADGTFLFTDLRPGTYTVTQPTQPAGTTNGQTVPGSVGGTATAPAVTPSAISGVAVPVGVTAANYLFGEIPESADLVVIKTHAKTAFTVGLTGSYQITVRNAGSQPSTSSYTVQDRLPTGLTLVATPTGTGWTCTGSAGASSFSCTGSATIAAGASLPNAITAVVSVGAAAQTASPVSNVVLVEGGGEVAARGPTLAERDAFNSNPASLPVCTNPASHNVCRDPTIIQAPASVSGTVWFDAGSSSRLLDNGDRRLSGWLVEVVDPTTGTSVGTAATDATGAYRVNGLEPGIELAVRFRDPASRVVFGYPVNGETAPGSSGASCAAGAPAAGSSSSCPVAAPNPQLVVVLAAGVNLPQQSLPVDPSGVVYDAVTRSPVGGAVVTLAPNGVCVGWNPSTAIAGAMLGGYTINGAAVSMTVGNDGLYQFLLTPTAPARCTFDLTVRAPSGYQFVSTLIPPTAGTLAPAGDASTSFAVQAQAGAPSGAPGPATAYYLSVVSGSASPSVVHNHIPLDPIAIGALSLSKTGDRSVAELGDSVRYTLTIAMASGGRPIQTSVVDRLPAGFTYIPGSATVNDRPLADPAGGVGPTLVFNLGLMPASQQYVLRYRVRVGVGAQQGDGVNRAQAHACQLAAGCVDAGNNPISTAISTNRAEFRVRVIGGVFTTESCVLGKVFVDCNNNHLQDHEELGIPGVRLVLSDGTALISDSEGKYSLCGIAPRSHVLRIDPSTLPRGSRLTTSSNRNLGDAGSLWLDLKNGELHRADFIEGSCSNTVLEQTKARRAQGEVRSVETEKKGGPVLRFDSKAHQLDSLRSPQQGTDGANQQAPKARDVAPRALSPAKDETNVPTPQLPMNQPPPTGRSPGDAADSAKTTGGSHGKR